MVGNIIHAIAYDMNNMECIGISHGHIDLDSKTCDTAKGIY